jgi:MFS family permease
MAPRASTLVQGIVIVAASLIGGHLSDRTGRRKIFVFTAAIVYGLAMFAVAMASNFNGFLVGMGSDSGNRSAARATIHRV